MEIPKLVFFSSTLRLSEGSLADTTGRRNWPHNSGDDIAGVLDAAVEKIFAEKSLEKLPHL